MEHSIQKILSLVEVKESITAKELREELGVSQVLVHRHLKTLCAQNKIKKIGSAPRVFYVPVRKQKKVSFIKSEIIHENWLEILPNGEFIFGEDGFVQWCCKRKSDVHQKAKEYEKMFHQKESYKEKGLIDATQKIITSFDQNYLEKIWYVDFYSWEIFGKTLLGKLILYAKQNSDEVLMKKIVEKVQYPIESLIIREKFDMIGIIPHSVSRKKDFLATTMQFLRLDLKPKQIFMKIFQEHVVAQKTLKSKEERQMNAEETLFLKDEMIPKKILLIDDACGSGATLNIAAQKIRQKFPNTIVYGLTFVGSMNGFEVINET
jgi:predicted amidophosphoribosyltransferase